MRQVEATHSRDISQLKDLFNGNRLLAHNVIHLLLSLLVAIRVLEQRVKQERQRSRRRFMASNQESNEVISDTDIVHFLASLGIDTVHHGRQKVLPLAVGIGSSSCHDFVCDLAHHLDVLKVLFRYGAVEYLGHRRTLKPLP